MYLLARVVERLLQAALFVGVIGVVISLVKLQWLVALGCLLMAGLALFAFFHVRCPRCGEPAGADLEGRKSWGREKERGGPVTAGDCPSCGRSRDGVLPFQYLLRPEPNPEEEGGA